MIVGVLDYNAGNLTSVKSALKYLTSEDKNSNFFVSDNPEELLKSDKLIFPGVGQAENAMLNLKQKNLDTMLKDFVKKGKLLLGICLGNQIILETSEENNTECLGLIKGEVKLFPKDLGMKVPQIGWNSVEIVSDNQNAKKLFSGIPKDSSFYFVHSYYTKPKNINDVVATTKYGIDFVSVINRENIFSTQFHPEKSGKSGLKLLDNFLRM